MNSTGLILNATENSKIESAKEIWKADDSLKVSYPYFLLGLFIIIIIYLGPFFYLKIYKKKTMNLQNTIGIKHVI